jgi:hypothetical protein
LQSAFYQDRRGQDAEAEAMLEKAKKLDIALATKLIETQKDFDTCIDDKQCGVFFQQVGNTSTYLYGKQNN